MKISLSGTGKWILLAVFLLAAGCFYSCGFPGVKEEVSFAAAETEPAGAAPAEPEETAAEQVKTCYVYVCGEVVSPGVYEMSEGQRIFEAIDLAGGFTERAAGEWLNLADTVQDGMKLEVPDRDSVPEQVWTSDDGAQNQAGRKVNINTAGAEELMTLTGIGQSRAEAIIAYRRERGKFSRPEDIMEVPGIKDAAFKKIKDDITV